MSTPAAMAELRAASVAMRNGQWQAAQGAVERALQCDAGNPDAWNLLGVIAAQAGRADQAHAAFDRAVKLRPAYRNAWDNLIALYEQSGQIETAASVAEQALSAAPSGHAHWHAAGVLLYRTGHPVRAGRCLDMAVQQSPQTRLYRHDLAVVRCAEQRTEEARQLIAELVESPHATVSERANYAAIWSHATQASALETVLVQAQHVLAQVPGHANVMDSAAIALAKLGRRDEAIAMARRALAAQPDYAPALHTLAHALQEEAQPDQLLAAIAEHGELYRQDSRIPRLKADALLKLDQPAAALDELDLTLQLRPDDQTAIALRALALYGTGQAEAARDWLALNRFLASEDLLPPEGFDDVDHWLSSLARDIRQHSRLRFEPIGLAAKGGWLTDELMADQTPAILGFHKRLCEAIQGYIQALPNDGSHLFLRNRTSDRWTLHLWATRTLEGGVIDTHVHEDSWLSGAFYVQLPPGLGSPDSADAKAGWIEYGRPHRGLPDVDESELLLVRPVPGRLLLFPSYVFHRTLPFAGDGERISISFDLVFV